MRPYIQRLNSQSVLIIALILFLSYIPLFHKLDSLAVFMWDEAFYAKNSIETTLNNNFIVLTEDGQVSPFNTKPPLVIWAQSLCMRVLGINTLALRLPSALAGLVIVVALMIFFRKQFKSNLMVFTAAMTLLTAAGFISMHVTRSGDLDAVLSMFTMLYCLYFFNALLSEKIPNRFYFIMALLVTMAVYSKSVAGLMLLPGLALSALISEKRKTIFCNVHLYLAAFGGLLLIAIFYIIRETLAPGFVSMVWNSEIVRFNNDITPWHQHPFFWFIDRFAHTTFYPLIYLMPVAIIAGVLSKTKKIRQLTTYTTITILGYLFLISYPPDKLYWYDAPLYGLFAVLTAVLFFEANYWLSKIIRSEKIRFAGLMLTAIAVFYQPYLRIYHFTEQQPKIFENIELEAVCLKRLIQTDANTPDVLFYKPAMPINRFQVDFYAAELQQKTGMELQQTDTIAQIKSGQKVLVCQEDKHKILLDSFEVKQTADWQQCRVYSVLGRK